MTMQPLLRQPPGPRVTPLLRRADLLSQGHSDNRIRRALRAGALTSIAPGFYLSSIEFSGLEPVARHRALVWALVPGLAGDPVVSHLSAAVVHGLLTESDHTAALLPGPVHIIRAGPTKSRRGPLLQVHRARLTPPEAVPIDGLALTAVPRTVLDCAFTLPFETAVDIARAALTDGAVSEAELTDQLTRQTRTPGMRRVSAVLRAAVSGPP